MARGIAAIVIGNFGSKAAGVAREVIFASWFGTGDVAAAFRIAQTAYLLPIQALVGDSLSAGLLPLYRSMQNEGQESPRVLLLAATLTALLFSAIMTTLLYIFAREAAVFIAPGASTTALNLATGFLKIMALATPFYILSGMLSYIEAAYGRFGAIAWRPMLLNIGSIGGAAVAVWFGKDNWLAVGVLLSHVAFFSWTLWQLQQLDKIWPQVRPSGLIIRVVGARFMNNLWPLLGLPLAAQMNVLIERIVSSWLGTSVIPSVDYARFVCDTTVQLVAVPLGILTMATQAGSSTDNMRRHITEIAKAISILAFPIAAFFGTNAEAIVRLLFARGAFDENSVLTTTAVLTWMGSASGMTLIAYYLVKALNTQLRNKEALIFTTIACAVNALINVLLWQVLGVQVVGVAICGNAFTLSLLCILALGLWKPMLIVFLSMAPTLVIQIATALTIDMVWGRGALVALILNIVIATTLWSATILGVPSLRNAARPLLVRLPVLRRLFR